MKASPLAGLVPIRAARERSARVTLRKRAVLPSPCLSCFWEWFKKQLFSPLIKMVIAPEVERAEGNRGDSLFSAKCKSQDGSTTTGKRWHIYGKRGCGDRVLVNTWPKHEWPHQRASHFPLPKSRLPALLENSLLLCHFHRTKNHFYPMCKP